MNQNAKHSQICRQIVTMIRRRGGYAKQMHGSMFQDAGIADVICCVDGLFVAFEVKTGAGRLTAIQKHDQEQVRRAGGIKEVVRSVVEAERILD